MGTQAVDMVNVGCVCVYECVCMFVLCREGSNRKKIIYNVHVRLYLKHGQL